jgi:type 1 fimbria pilin
MKTLRVVGLSALVAALVACGRARAQEHKHDEAGGTVTVTGEVLDMACYLDHGAQGEKHAKCALTCIELGLPVGIKGSDGKTYLVIGEHKPLNKELAAYAAKTITVKGKLVERDGFRMIANAEIMK